MKTDSPLSTLDAHDMDLQQTYTGRIYYSVGSIRD